MEETWEREGQKLGRENRQTPAKEPGWRSTCPVWHGHPGELHHATAGQSLGRQEVMIANKQNTVFLLADGSMARELKIGHVGASTALSFISSSPSDLQHSQR